MPCNGTGVCDIAPQGSPTQASIDAAANAQLGQQVDTDIVVNFSYDQVTFVLTMSFNGTSLAANQPDKYPDFYNQTMYPFQNDWPFPPVINAILTAAGSQVIACDTNIMFGTKVSAPPAVGILVIPASAVGYPINYDQPTDTYSVTIPGVEPFVQTPIY